MFETEFYFSLLNLHFLTHSDWLTGRRGGRPLNKVPAFDALTEVIAQAVKDEVQEDAVAVLRECVLHGRPQILASCSNVTIKTTEDAKAVLRACLYGRLEKPTIPTTNTGNPVKGYAHDSRRLQVVSGTAIVFAGRRYLDGCNWTKTGTDNNFQTHHQQDRPDMLKRTIRFAYKSLLVTVVSYQATGCTHPSASSIPAPDPMDEPLPSELKLNAARKGKSGEPSGIPDDNDDDISTTPIGETAFQLNLGTSFHTPRSEHDVEQALDGLDRVTNLAFSRQFTESTLATTSQKPINRPDGSRIIGKLLTLKEMLNPIDEQEAGGVMK